MASIAALLRSTPYDGLASLSLSSVVSHVRRLPGGLIYGCLVDATMIGLV